MGFVGGKKGLSFDYQMAELFGHFFYRVPCLSFFVYILREVLAFCFPFAHSLVDIYMYGGRGALRFTRITSYYSEDGSDIVIYFTRFT
jgi:hypothetical protein